MFCVVSKTVAYVVFVFLNLRLYVCVFRRLWSWSHVLFQGLWSTLNNWPKWEHLRTMEARREICKQLHLMIFGRSSDDQTEKHHQRLRHKPTMQKRRWERSSAVFTLKAFQIANAMFVMRWWADRKTASNLDSKATAPASCPRVEKCQVGWVNGSFETKQIFDQSALSKIFVKKWSGSVS